MAPTSGHLIVRGDAVQAWQECMRNVRGDRARSEKNNSRLAWVWAWLPLGAPNAWVTSWASLGLACCWALALLVLAANLSVATDCGAAESWRRVYGRDAEGPCIGCAAVWAAKYLRWIAYASWFGFLIIYVAYYFFHCWRKLGHRGQIYCVCEMAIAWCLCNPEYPASLWMVEFYVVSAAMFLMTLVYVLVDDRDTVVLVMILKACVFVAAYLHLTAGREWPRVDAPPLEWLLHLARAHAGGSGGNATRAGGNATHAGWNGTHAGGSGGGEHVTKCRGGSC